MKWFNRWPKASIPAALVSDQKIEVEAQSLRKIKNICSIAMSSADRLAQSSHGDLAEGERRRFESAKRISLELAKNITDVSYRDAALEHIVELCMAANDIDTARILVRGIQTGMIRERLLAEHPVAFY